MRFYSSNNRSHQVSFRTAVLNGQPPEGGLYMPCSIPRISDQSLSGFKHLTVPELAWKVLRPFTRKEIPTDVLLDCVNYAYSFPVPMKPLLNNLFLLELFHGPSHSFKDFGARFLAFLLGWLNKESGRQLNVLVATTGDTGAAVASSFNGIQGTRAIILYPKGRISSYQEYQINKFGGNIVPICINGTFDDCQRLVKMAFADSDIRNSLNLTSANSINIGRLIAQIPYYFLAKSFINNGRKIVFSVPSGNLGNVTAGVMARKMGRFPADFIIATNANKVIPDFFDTGHFKPVPAVYTLANAMDVGNPSNFTRLKAIFGSTWNSPHSQVHSVSTTDLEITETISSEFLQRGILLDPHTACAFNALKKHQPSYNQPIQIVLSTAHLGKFSNVSKTVNSIPPDCYFHSPSHFVANPITLDSTFLAIKEWLLSNR